MESVKKIEVTYADTDMAGIVYHGSYIPWFELARTQYLQDMGFTMIQCIEKNLVFPITDLQLKYKSPTKYLDDVEIRTTVLKFSKVATTYSHKVYANGVLSVDAQITLAHVDTEQFKVVNLYKRFKELYVKYDEVING